MAHLQQSLIALVASVTGDDGAVTVTGLDASTPYYLPTVTSGNQFWYGILTDGAGNWEYGLGQWSGSGNGTTTFGTFIRQTVLRSKSGASLPANFSGNPVTLIFDIPAEKGLFLDGSGNIVNGDLIANAVNVKDFATLVARTVPTANNVVFNIGYGRTLGDGLGGKFIYQSGSSATADDHTTDVTVNTIAPAVGAGRYLRVFDATPPVELSGDASAPSGALFRNSTSKDLRSKHPTLGGLAIPETVNFVKASFATLSALKAQASSIWKQGDLIVLRGILADADIQPIVGVWQAASTNTDALDKTYVRPDDISGGNAGRVQFPFDINSAIPPRLFTITSADGAATTFDIAKYIPNKNRALVLYDRLLVDPADYAITVDTPAVGQTRFIFSGFTPAAGVPFHIFA